MPSPNDDPPPVNRRIRIGKRILTRTEAVTGMVLLGLSASLAVLVFLGVEDWRLIWPDRKEQDRSVKPLHLAQTLAWWGLFAKFGLLFFLGLSVRWWYGRLPQKIAPEDSGPVMSSKSCRTWLAILAILLVVAAGLRYPRMDLSLYNDEVYGFEKYVSGRFVADDSGGSPEFKPVPWNETWWGNRLGNNFPLYSIKSRAIYDFWKWATDAGQGEVSEWALRLPSLLGGLLSIALAAFFLMRMGLPGAGLIVADVLAFHPAHIRYSTEARGYGMAFAAVVVVAWCWWEALRHDRWKAWIGLGLAQIILLLCYPGAVYWLLVLNLSTLSWLVVLSWKGHRDLIDPPRGRQMLIRWTVTNAVAATLFFTLCSPQILQAQLAHADPNYMKDAMPPTWWLDVGAFLFWGILWKGGDMDLAHMPGLSQWPAALAVLSLALPLLVWVALLSQSGRRGPPCVILLASVPVSILAAWAHNASRGVFMHHWYAVHLVPLLAVVTIAGLARFPNAAPVGAVASGAPESRWSWRLAAMAALALWFVIALSHWQVIGWTSKEPLRLVIEKVRGDIYPNYLGTEGERLLLGGFFSNANVYDPNLVVVRSAEDLKALIEQSKERDLPLYITHGSFDQARGGFPEVMAMLHDDSRFRLVERLDGLGGEQSAHFVLKLAD